MRVAGVAAGVVEGVSDSAFMADEEAAFLFEDLDLVDEVGGLMVYFVVMRVCFLC